MKILLAVILTFGYITASAQIRDDLKDAFPAGTIFHQNIRYADDTVKKHVLDIYLPPKVSDAVPLIVWIHGGAWMVNDKYADMGYMKKTIHGLLQKGYAIASIDYRFSTTAVFPAQVHDCIQAIQFLYDHSKKYHLDGSNIVLMGFSAGGHLASLLALSHNDNVASFYPGGRKPTFNIKGVVDFYGPAELLLWYANDIPGKDESPIGKLIGASPLVRPDLSRIASPVSYVNKNDPPFMIVHGEKDPDVPPTQSYLLKSYLDLAGIRNDLLVVKGAPHYGEAFDVKEVQDRVFAFLSSLK